MILILCSFFMLPYFYVSAEPLPIKFEEVVEQINSFHNKDLDTAIKLTTFFEKQFSKFSLQERIRFKKLQAQLYSDKTEYKLAKAAANDGLDLTKKLSHPSITMAELLNLRGFAIERTGEYKQALKDYKAALEIAESLDDRKVVIHTLTNLGAIYCILEEYERSLIVLNDALIQAQELNDNGVFGLVYTELAILYNYINQRHKSQVFYEQALEYFIKANEPYNILIGKQNVAISYAANKKFVEAIKLYEKVIVEAKKAGSFSAISYIYSKMAQAYLNKTPSDAKTAYHYITLAEKFIKPVDEIGYEIALMVNKADVLTKLERYKEALEVISKSESILAQQPVDIRTYTYLDILRIKAELLFAQGKYQEAYQTQNILHQEVIQINKRNNFKALDELRIEYESKQQEIQAEILEKKQYLQSLALKEVNENQRNRNFYIFICILTALGLAWFYSVNLNNQKKLLSSRETDHLTGLPNRQTILSIGASEFNQAVKNDNDYSVLIIKVDNFSNINQVKGYEIGNNILIELSLIISDLIGDNAKCGRYSSNEFIVLLSATDVLTTEIVANDIHNHIYKKVWDKYGLKVVSVSIGISNNRSDFIESYEALIKNARVLKQHAVISGGNTVCI